MRDGNGERELVLATILYQSFETAPDLGAAESVAGCWRVVVPQHK